jgi:hypothetical protein
VEHHGLRRRHPVADQDREGGAGQQVAQWGVIPSIVLAKARGALYSGAMSYFSHSWLPYIYQYGLGGLIFIIGLWITLKSGSFSPAHPRHRKWLVVLILGFIWYLVLHGALTLAALGHELSALIGAVVVMSVSIALSVMWSRKHRGEA